MGYHNETCGCAECGNYGQRYNPHAIHNQSCGCAECGNYPQAAVARPTVDQAPATVEMVAVPVGLLDDVRALIARRNAEGTVEPHDAGPSAKARRKKKRAPSARNTGQRKRKAT